jgi:hypothetical protein
MMAILRRDMEIACIRGMVADTPSTGTPVAGAPIAYALLRRNN